MGQAVSTSVPAFPQVNFEDDWDPFEVGRELHRQISPDRWCVTKEDLVYFQKEVLLAWKAGRIPNNPEHPNPLHDNLAFGPTMYAVTDHVIKPLTAKYGGMSFALMLHPAGLQCDVFVTHAWAIVPLYMLGLRVVTHATMAW